MIKFSVQSLCAKMPFKMLTIMKAAKCCAMKNQGEGFVAMRSEYSLQDLLYCCPYPARVLIPS